MRAGGCSRLGAPSFKRSPVHVVRFICREGGPQEGPTNPEATAVRRYLTAYFVHGKFSSMGVAASRGGGGGSTVDGPELQIHKRRGSAKERVPQAGTTHTSDCSSYSRARRPEAPKAVEGTLLTLSPSPPFPQQTSGATTQGTST